LDQLSRIGNYKSQFLSDYSNKTCPGAALLSHLSPSAPAPSLLQNPLRLKPQSVSAFCPHTHFGKILLIWTIQDDLIANPPPTGSTFEIHLDVSQLVKKE